MLAQALDFNVLNAKLQEIGYKWLPGATLGNIISFLLPYLFAAAGILLLLYLIFGGLQLMFAKGDPKAIQAAWSKITNAVIGFVIVFLSYWITQLFGELLNIQIIKGIFK